MKRAAVFFDRDNTLIASDGYLGNPASVVLVEGAADAVARARQYGFKAVTFSNQSGVARGLFGEEDVRAVNQRMDELLQQANASAVIEHHEYCPYHPDAVVEQYKEDSFLRKPKPGMILAAAEKLNLDLTRSWVVGDAPRDIEAGRAAGCRTILFTDPTLERSPAAEVESDITADFTVESLRDAIEIIARESLCKPAAKATAAVTAGVLANPLRTSAAPAADEEPPISPSDAAMADVMDEPATDTPPAPPAPPAPPTLTPSAVLPASCGTSARAAAVPPIQQVAPGKAELVSPKVERLLEQILTELRRREEPPTDFSVSKLMAGIVQIMALAVFFLAYLRRDDLNNLNATLMFALVLQTLTIALLIMGRQR